MKLPPCAVAATVALAVAVALTACGSRPANPGRSPGVALPAPAPGVVGASAGGHGGNGGNGGNGDSGANGANSVILPPARYGRTEGGLQLTRTDDACDVPASLSLAIRDHLQLPYRFTHAAPSPALAGAPTLRIEITELLENAGGLYGGPKAVQLRGVLETPEGLRAHFRAQRRMFLYFGPQRSTCGMVGQVIDSLGSDIARWLSRPVDGARLGVW